MGRHFDFKPGGRFIPTCVGRMGCRDELTFGTTGSSAHAWGEFPNRATALSLLTVHPHVRGANSMTARTDTRSGRFIPTCVGRMRFAGFLIESLFGSSPRAWGKCTPGSPPSLAGTVHPHGRRVLTHGSSLQQYHVAANSSIPSP